MPAKPVKSNLGLRLVIVFVVVAAAVGVAIFGLRPVARTAVAYKDKAIDAVPGSVNVQAEYIQDLTSEVEGRVLNSELDPGKAVKKGEVLAQLDPKILQLEIEQLKSDYAAAKKRQAIGSSTAIERDNAKDALDNAVRENKLGRVSEMDLTKQKRAFQMIQQKLDTEVVTNEQLIATMENTLQVKEDQLRKMTFTAPFDGVVSVVTARPGALLAAKSPIATLISVTRTVEAKISEENFAGIKLGQKATVRFLVYGDPQFDAKVIKILPTADPETQRYILHLDVNIEYSKLRPGITGEVSIIIAERENATLIPRRALRDNRVWVVSDGRVAIRKVEVGYVALDVAEITKGLAVGERVIVEELDKFQDGDRVRVEAAK